MEADTVGQPGLLPFQALLICREMNRLDVKTFFKRVRTNEPAPQHVALLSNASGLERLYIVSQRNSKTGLTPDDGTQPPVTPDDSQPEIETATLGKQYIHAITRHHGSTMRHLLLWDQWHFDQDEIREIIRFCPNLEQLGIGVNSEDSLRAIHLLVPFLPKLKALRLLLTTSVQEMCAKGNHLETMGTEFAKLNSTTLRYIGIGERTFRVDPLAQVLQPSVGTLSTCDITEIKVDEVQHVEIWGMDHLDITLDPMFPFDP